jgi:hypothetical protein
LLSSCTSRSAEELFTSLQLFSLPEKLKHKKQPSFYSVVQFQFYSATTSSKVLIQLPKKKLKGSADLQSAGMAETTSHSQESSWCLKIFICDRIANLSQPNDLSQGCFSPSNTSAEQDNIFEKEQNLLGGHLKVHLHPI